MKEFFLSLLTESKFVRLNNLFNDLSINLTKSNKRIVILYNKIIIEQVELLVCSTELKN